MLTANDISIRDPFILPVPEEHAYYLFGTTGAFESPEHTKLPCFRAYRTEDLVNFEEPAVVFKGNPDFWATRDFWAPEVHKIGGRYYMFASFKSDNACRGTQILVCDTPAGTYQPITETPVTPRDWECLDGTYYQDDEGNPWIVFCHEWLQIHNGTICAMPLTNDLTQAAGDPTVLFHAADAPCAPKGRENYVTDGPFVFRMEHGKLGMLWSTGIPGTGYAQLLATSDHGILGPWKQAEDPVFISDGGHGMLFTTFESQRMLTLHSPNSYPEHPRFFPIEERDGTLYIKQ
ncbi:MAG: glycoside hydrolase family 43 protein [Clostridia bacterium]|nr:glycoside hydrolase family 43 protein [Clostridia bacterium]